MRSASGEGLAVSNRSPATTTRSTDSRSATAAISARTAWCSAARDRPRTALPTCQSAVCSSFTATPPPRSRLREAGERAVGRLGRGGAVGTAGGCRRGLAGLAGPGGPRRERELDDERDRQLGLGDDHRARLDDRGPLALGGRQEAVLAPGRLGGVEPAHDADGRVGHDAPLDLAGRLLGADEHDAERPAPLGDVEQDLLDRAEALAGRVLVQLVEHDELQRPCLARALLAPEGLAEDDADDEALGPVV